MQHGSLRCGLIGIAALLAGCASTSASRPAATVAPHVGAVGVHDITALVPMVARMVIAEDETFFMPMAQRENALPDYPPALLALRLPPQLVCLRLGIDSTGAVMDAAPMASAPDCPEVGRVEARFFDAAIATARGWHFEPAVRCAYPNEIARKNQDCTGGRETPQAVSLAYQFVFEQHDGRGSVRLSDKSQ